MELNFLDYVTQVLQNPALLITNLLTLGVILVNGWTDAPNAIATCVSTRSLRPKTAIILSAVFNFLGVLVMTSVNATVAYTIYDMVDFGGDSRNALIALCAAMVAIVVWAVTAWFFGIPTSESHALIAGLSGSAIALGGGFHAINGGEWIKVVYGLVLSTVLGFGLAFVIAKLVQKIGKQFTRKKANDFFDKAQIGSAAAMSFMHGAQDGQKFMAVFLLGIFLMQGNMNVTQFAIPIWLMILCSLVMAFGTSIGGYKIIKSVGMDMAKLHKYQGFSADVAATICLLLSSFTGLPVSTTHTKTTAVMGVGAAKRVTSVNWGIVKEMFLAWVLTFPGCGLIGFLMTKLFLMIF